MFGHSKREDQAADDGGSPAAAPESPESPDFDALLQHFSELPVAQRAAEVLAGIAPQLPHRKRSAMDNLLSAWLGNQYSAADQPDSWYALKYVLAEAFQALELSRMVFRIDESPQGHTTCYYTIVASQVVFSGVGARR